MTDFFLNADLSDIHFSALQHTDRQTDTIMAMGQQYDFNMAYDVLVVCSYVVIY